MKILIGKKAGKAEGGKSRENIRAAIGAQKDNVLATERQEVRSIRGRKSKFYSLGQNRMLAEIYDESIHYYDYNDKTFKNIDLNFDEKDDLLETRSNSFKARFNRHPHNGKIFELEKNLCKIGLTFCDISDQEECVLQNCECREHEYECNRVFLRNAKKDTDIEYIVTPKRIKENIIINDRLEKYEFNFDLSLDNIVIDVSWDGKRLELMKKDSGRPQFFIPAPYMFDANGEKSDDVYYEIDQEDAENIKLKVVADANWINAAERKFPVTIDPMVEMFEEYGAYYEQEDYEEGIFRYYTVRDNEQISEGEMHLKSSAQLENQIGFNICILKNRLKDYLRRNFTQVLLKLKMKPGGNFEGFAVGAYDGYTLMENGEITVNITSFFATNEDEIEITFRNVGRDMDFKNNDAYFYPPVLQIEYNNYMQTIDIQTEPTKTHYIPGEAFDPSGMKIVAIYDDGQTIPVNDYKYTPEGALGSYDKEIVITYETAECSQPVTVEEGWVDDRRGLENRENMYQLQEVDSDGNPKKDVEVRYVKLTLFDGLEDNSAQIGTPLNAASLNNLRVRAENIVGKIQRENLPDDLQWEDSSESTESDETSNV